MITNRRSFLHRAALLSLAAVPVPVLAQRLPKPPFVQAKACIVVDAVSGQSLFEKNADTRRPVASTQKLLSALVALESTSMDKMACVELEETKVEPIKLRLQVGEKLPMRTLLQAM